VTAPLTELPGLDELEGQLWRDLLAMERDYQASRSPEIGPSDVRALHPKGCERQLAYRVHGTEPSDPEPEWLIRQAVMGTAVHAHIAAARRLAHPHWLVEARVQVPGFDRPGAVDACGDGTCDDVKTKSDRGYEAITNRGIPYEADHDQVLLYALGLEDDGVDVRRCSVTYVNRSDGQSQVHSWSYDRGEALLVADRMHGLIDRVDLLDPVDVPRGGQAPEWRPCDSCPFRSLCWNLDDVPEGYTALSYELADAEVADAAEQLRLVRAEGTANKEAQEYLRMQLEGHGGKTFMDSDGITRRIAWSAGKPYGQGGALDQTAARQLLTSYGVEPPTLGVAPRLTFPAVRS
jgi:hypothetical protein